jgi:hypothetical protein
LSGAHKNHAPKKNQNSNFSHKNSYHSDPQ